MLRRYAYGPGIDDRIAMLDTAACAGGGRCFYQTNHQGSTIALTNQVAGLVETYGYDAFGRSSAALTGNAFRYTGRRFDPETGLYYYRARYYSSNLGRFLQTDPIGTKDDLNLYAYTYNDPANKVDPRGEAAIVPLAIWGVKAYRALRAAQAAYKVAKSTAVGATVTGTLAGVQRGSFDAGMAAAVGGGVEGAITGKGAVAAETLKSAKIAAAVIVGSNSAGSVGGTIAESEMKGEQVSTGDLVVSATAGGALNNASTLGGMAARDAAERTGRNGGAIETGAAAVVDGAGEAVKNDVQIRAEERERSGSR